MLTSLLRGFANGAYYVGADPGAFNAVGDGGTFGAYVTFIYTSDAQIPGGVPVRQYLWGNSVDASFSGWSLEIEVAGGEAVLQAKVGGGGAYTAVQEPLTGPSVVATGQAPAPGIFNRLIQASLWCDDTNLILAVNGTICNYAAFDAGTLTPSIIAAQLGAGGAAVPAVNAARCDIVSAGYTNFPGLNVAGNVEGFMGFAFDAARATGNSGYIIQSAGIDWTHRYDVRVAGQGLRGSLTRTSHGAVATAPLAPSTLVDQGSSGLGNLALPPVAPCNLVRGGASVTGPVVTQRANVDWANMGTFFYTP